MLPVSPHSPGLELATSAVHWGTGLPLMACQIVVVALARTVLVLGLYLLGSRLAGSARGGGIVVLLYAASPQFWFFNAQFSYQTVALAMVMLHLLPAGPGLRQPEGVALDAAGHRAGVPRRPGDHPPPDQLDGQRPAWCCSSGSGRRRRFRPGRRTAELATAAWTAGAPPLLIDYLTPIFDAATSQLAGLLQAAPRARWAPAAAAPPRPRGR